LVHPPETSPARSNRILKRPRNPKAVSILSLLVSTRFTPGRWFDSVDSRLVEIHEGESKKPGKTRDEERALS
jgi:hypothetical protein